MVDLAYVWRQEVNNCSSLYEGESFVLHVVASSS